MPTMDTPARWIAMFFGAGLAPVAPGTAGTLAAIPLYLLASCLGPLGYFLVTAAVIVIGTWASEGAARELGVHDHPSIVVDEVAGFLVTMALLPVSWVSVVLGFIAFRAFDIIKPWPIRWLDARVSGGIGIMLDDLVAAIPAHLLTAGALFLLPV